MGYFYNFDFVLELIFVQFQIDFGDSIDFGDDNTSTDTPSTSNGDFVKLDKDELSIENEINWDINDDTECCNQQQEIISSSQPVLLNDTKVAKDEDAQTVLLCSEYRNKFINELIEVCSYEFFVYLILQSITFCVN